MTLDTLIEGALVVDGTGRAPFVSDVGVSDGQIVQVGPGETARRKIRADGLVACPGFIDIHTHYDAQVFWDPLCLPSPLHGVTTVIAGNCGLTLAPLRGGDEKYLIKLLSRVESIPMEAITAGVPFSWSSFPAMLDEIDSMGPGVNIGFLVGHCALRRAVMGDDATARSATGPEVSEMVQLLEEALSAGGLGLSTETVRSHVDLDGRESPAHFAAREEFLSLASVCRKHVGTNIEFIPGSTSHGFTEEDIQLLIDVALAADRPLNWNMLMYTPHDPDLHERQLRIFEHAAAWGARIVGLTVPHNSRWRLGFGPGNLGFRLIPDCEWLFDLTLSDLVKALRAPLVRARVRAAVDAATSGFAGSVARSMPTWILNDVSSKEFGQYVGWTAAELASQMGRSVLDAILDVAVASNTDCGFVRHRYDYNEKTWLVRESLLRNKNVVLGASDAGAHVDAISYAEYPTAALRELVIDRPVFSLEELIRLLTSVPADLMNLRNRGRISPGAVADLVLFDPETVGPNQMELRYDFPSGAQHLVSTADGIEYVFVGGVEIVESGEVTDARPGHVIRLGKDTG